MMLTKIVSQSAPTLASKPSILQAARLGQRTFSSGQSKTFQRTGFLNSVLGKSNVPNGIIGTNLLSRSNSSGFKNFSTSTDSTWSKIMNVYKRDTNLDHLIAEADANPQDATKQYQLLLHMKSDADRIARFEDNRFAHNEHSLALYLDALRTQGQLEKLKFSNNTVSVEQIQKMQVVKTRMDSIRDSSSIFAAITCSLSVLATAYVICSFLNNNNNSDGEREDDWGTKKSHSVINSKPKERFSDVHGVDEVKVDLQEVVQYLREPTKFTSLGASLPKGVLLCGEPGTGKTLLARAIAGEAGVPFLYASGSSFDEMFVGVGQRRVRELFKEARELAPCIIFIDEIDGVGGDRSQKRNSDDTLNQLLTEMDGFNQTEGIIVIGATNLPSKLDPALVRPGRFDKQVVVHAPDTTGRKAILNHYLKKTTAAPDVNVERLAKVTTGFTGADLFNLINQSAIKAALRGENQVDMKTIEESRDDIIMGGKKRELFRTEEEKLMTAYHEGGHTLVAIYSDGAYPVHKATIAPRGNALGVTSFMPEDVYSRSRKQMRASLNVAMGGRAAEELIYGEDGVNTGAAGDFQSATNTARRMITELGFSDKVGKVYHSSTRTMVSQKELEVIDSEVKNLIDQSYTDAKNILSHHKKELHLLAKALMDHETLSVEEIKKVIAGEKLPMPEGVKPVVGESKKPSSSLPLKEKPMRSAQ